MHLRQTFAVRLFVCAVHLRGRFTGMALHGNLPGWRFAFNESNVFDGSTVAYCSDPGGR
jgi:hypothetical protein